MQELVRAAAEIAQKTGANIIIVGAQSHGGAPGANGTSDPLAFKHAEEQIRGLTGEVQMLRTKLVEAEKALGAATQAAQGGNSGPLIAENGQLKAKINELQGLVSQLQSRPAAAAPTPGAPVAAPGAFVDCPLDVLGLEAAVLKKVQKMTLNSVGALHGAFMAGNIYAKTTEKPDGKFTKDEVIDIAVRLMGKVPPAAGAPAGPGAASAAPAPGGAPSGVSDLPWAVRLDKCKTKEGHINDAKRAHAALQAELAGLTKLEATPDTGEKIVACRAKVAEAEINVRLLEKQLLAMLFFCGFDVKKAQTVETCLKAHGLESMIQTAAPVGAGA